MQLSSKQQIKIKFQKHRGALGLDKKHISKSHQKTYLALTLIKHDYTIKNKYLKSTFHHSFNIKDELEIVSEESEHVAPIQDKNGDFLFGLKQVEDEDYRINNNSWLLLLIF